MQRGLARQVLDVTEPLLASLLKRRPGRAQSGLLCLRTRGDDGVTDIKVRDVLKEKRCQLPRLRLVGRIFIPARLRVDVLRIDTGDADGVVKVEAVDMPRFRAHQHAVLCRLDDRACHRNGEA